MSQYPPNDDDRGQPVGLEMEEIKTTDQDESEDKGLVGANDDDLVIEKEHQLHEVRSRADSLVDADEVDIWKWDNCGYLAQYFAVGIIYGGLPGTVYGFYLYYLVVPAHIYSTAIVISTLPWSFKFVFGIINDTTPIKGYNRKPYMVLGWILCCMALALLTFMPMPDPYWCTDADGIYITTNGTDADGHSIPATPCNPEAQKMGGMFSALMMLAALGYVIADVAADGLTVQYARREPAETRGQTQTTIYLIRTIGQTFSSTLIAFGMNTPAYGGNFSVGFSYNMIMGIFFIPAALMIPLSWYRVVEPENDEEPVKLGPYLKQAWTLLESRAMFFVICYSFCNPVIANISTTAGGEVKQQWAKVENLQNQLFSLFGNIIFAFGLWLVKRYFLNYSWRCMLIFTTVLLNCADMCFSFPTIYDLFRNQYFYMGESVLFEIPMAANFVVSTFYIVEMADDGNEGLVYGLLTTIGNLGSPVAQAISNQLFAAFTPSLDDPENYITDSPSFRNTVAESFTLSYAFAFAAIGFTWLLPTQKEDAQRRKKEWGSSPAYAYITVSVISVALVYSLLVNILSMFPSTMCLKFAGGSGCDD